MHWPMRAGLRRVGTSSPAHNEETQHEQADEDQDCVKSARGHSWNNQPKTCEYVTYFFLFLFFSFMLIYLMCNIQKCAMFGLHCDITEFNNEMHSAENWALNLVVLHYWHTIFLFWYCAVLCYNLYCQKRYINKGDLTWLWNIKLSRWLVCGIYTAFLHLFV